MDILVSRRRISIPAEGILETVECWHAFETGLGGWITPGSARFICPSCAAEWARIEIEDEQMLWPLAAFCRRCTDSDKWHPVPGSIFAEHGLHIIDTELLEHLSPRMLQREFNLHLAQFEIGVEHETHRSLHADP